MAVAVEAPGKSLSGRGLGERILMYVFVVVPFTAMLAAIPLAWGYGWFSWTDLNIAVVYYCVTTAGIGIGFHRFLVHRSFVPNKALKVVLIIAGSLGVEGSPIIWVADHRKHHKYSDEEGDPHSPWRFGDSGLALAKGLGFAHVYWFLGKNSDRAKVEVYARQELGDPTVVRLSRLFPLFAVISLASPALIGGLLTMSWLGALTAFFWGSLVRMALMHHVTWSINSICHTVGNQPYVEMAGDKSRNFWPLALPSFGEAWHNLHHAVQYYARHGAVIVVQNGQYVLRNRMDINARIIWVFEKLGWATKVKWPDVNFLVQELKLPVPPPASSA